MLRRVLALAVFLGVTSPGLVSAAPEHVVPDIRGETRVQPRGKAHVVRIPLTIHIAIGDREIAFDTTRIHRSVMQANEAMRLHGLEVYVARIVLLPAGFAEIRHRRDRRKLAFFAPPDGTIHVFFVARLELGGLLRADRSVRGLHWRHRGKFGRLRNREYLVVSNDAPSTTLVHEIGHLFGLDHDASHQNLMCSCRQGPRQLFTALQGLAMRRGARAFLERQDY